MSDGAVSNSKRHKRWGALWSLGAAVGVWSSGSTCAPAQGVDYRSASAAPAEWQAFAAKVQHRFQDRLSADDAAAHAFQDYMAKRSADEAALTVIVRTWVLPDGRIERLEIDGIDDDGTIANVRSLLADQVLDVPPPDMLQPLRLRFLLRSADSPQRGG